MIDFKNYERVTNSNDYNNVCDEVSCNFDCENCYLGKRSIRLAELEDLIEQGKLVEKTENEKQDKLYKAIENYYEDLDSLAKRLQLDYGGDKAFEQTEEDRLAICAILDIFDEIKENVLNKKMTNREYLNSLTNEEFVNFIFYDFQIISKQYTQSTTGMLEWLEEEYKE